MEWTCIYCGDTQIDYVGPCIKCYKRKEVRELTDTQVAVLDLESAYGKRLNIEDHIKSLRGSLTNVGRLIDEKLKELSACQQEVESAKVKLHTAIYLGVEKRVNEMDIG